MTRTSTRGTKSLATGLVLALVAGCTPMAVDVPFAHKMAASEREFVEIAEALAEQYEFKGVPLPPPLPGEGPRKHVRRSVVLVSDTLHFCQYTSNSPPDQCNGANADYLDYVAVGSSVSAEDRSRIIEINQVSASFPCRENAWNVCATKAEVEELFSEDGWWPDFYDRFKGSAGFVEISVPLMSNERTSAKVYVSHRCDGLCGEGLLFVVEKRAGQWVIIKREQLWVS